VNPQRRTALVYGIICSLAMVAMFVGSQRRIAAQSGSAVVGGMHRTIEAEIPDIGSIEVLNGCGIPGAATAVTDFLRERGFDVKASGNAESWNYGQTIVVARSKDQTIAKKLCTAFHIDRLVLMRTGTDIFDASVIIGKDYGDLINER